MKYHVTGNYADKARILRAIKQDHLDNNNVIAVRVHKLAYPSYNYVYGRTSCASYRHVLNILKMLCDAGWLYPIYQGKQRKRVTNYKLMELSK